MRRPDAPPRDDPREPDAVVDLASDVLYEPVADLVQRRVVALAVPPAAGLEVWRTATRQTARWERQGLSLQLVITLSADDVAGPEMPSTLRGLLSDADLLPRQLVVEVAETGLVDSPSGLAAGARRIAALGAAVCLRDFGVGDSSLVLLRRLPLAALKVHADVVAALGESADADATLASAARVADAVGVRCDAAGVDTGSQLAGVAAVGCVRAQGAAVGAPVLALDIPAAIDACEVSLAGQDLRTAAPRRRRGEPERAVLLQMQDMYTGGASLPTIAAALNRAGSPHPEGIRWHPTAVARHLAAAQRSAASTSRAD